MRKRCCSSPVGDDIPAPARRQVSERTDFPQLSQVTQCQRITSLLTDAWSAWKQREARQTSGNIRRRELPGCLWRSNTHTHTHK